MTATMHSSRAATQQSVTRLLALLSLTLPVFTGCATAPLQAQSRLVAHSGTDVPGADYGIRLDGLRLSAHGYLLDLRYRVLDPARAAPLLDARKKVQLIDGARNAKLGVPESPVIGGMRQTSRNHVIYTDRDYFVLFVNPGRAVRSGETLDLAVDGVKIAQVTVE